MDFSNPLRAPPQASQQMYASFQPSAAFVRPTSPVSPVAPQQQQQQQQQQTLNVKAFYNEEIRRLVLPEPSWERLKQRLAELFHLPVTATFQVRWKDEEGDFITLDSDEELSQALRYTDSQQLLRLFIATQQSGACGAPRTGFLPMTHQGPFSSFFTHSTPYSSFSSSGAGASAAMVGSPPTTYPYYPARVIAPVSSSPDSNPSASGGATGGTSPAQGSGAAGSPSASAPLMVPGAVGALASLVGSPTGTLTAAQLYASTREFKEQWKQEKRTLKEQKYLCGNKEEWKALKKEQKKALKNKKELAKTSQKLMRMERVFDPQDPKDHKKLYKLQQKQYKTTARALYARFVKHVSIPDGTEMAPDTPFVKTWRFRNEGTMPWPQEVTLMFISKINGDQMGAPELVPVNKLVLPGEEVDVSVHMVSPGRAGHYQAYFRLCYGPKKFGQRVWIKINVACTSEADETENDEGEAESNPADAADTHHVKDVDNLVDGAECSGDLAPAAGVPTPTAPNRESVLLQKLSDLGFHDHTHNRALLLNHDGDLNAVVDYLLTHQRSTA